MRSEVSFEDKLLVREILLVVKERRIALGLSQAQLAERLSVPRTYMSKLDCSRAAPRLDTLWRLARGLDLEGGWKLVYLAERRLDRRIAAAAGKESAKWPRPIRKRRTLAGPVAPVSEMKVERMARAIGETIVSARKARGMSQGQLERLTTFTRPYISRLECGHICPELTSLEKFATALDTPAWNLLRCAEMRLAAPQSITQTPAA